MVELMPFSHIFRAGSQVRLVIDTPGASMARWNFALTDFDAPPTYSVGHDAVRPSSIVLPVIPGIEVPTELPECIRLRGQPCRTYEAFDNTPAE